MATLLGCQSGNGGPDAGRVPVDPTAESYPAPQLPRAKVVVPDAFGGKHAVEVEVAATPESRERGLMWRRSMADGKGMIFIFTHDQVQSFWMKNTLIYLDLIYIDARGRILGIVENAEPKNLEPRGVGQPGRYVLEVPGGWTGRAGVRPGVVVTFEGLEAIAVR